MDFDILDVIEDATKEADAFENHPVRELNMEEQVLYLNGLALVMNADGHIDDSEKEYTRILIKSIGLDESSLDDMVNFANAPDKDTVQAFFRTFRRRPIAQLFLFDALMMTRRDGKVEDKEVAVVNKIADQLEILKGTQQDIFDLFCHIKNRNWQESALYFSSHLLNPEHFKHLLAYHEVEFDELMAETTDIRRTRLLDVLKNKMPKAEAGENVKPKLDAEIVLPMLQAEVDRGNALVVNNQLTIKDDDSFGELDLASIGFEWDKETLSFYSKENIEISSLKIIQKFTELLNLNNMLDVINILYLGKVKAPIQSGLDGERTIKLKSNILKTNPFIEIEGIVFEYVTDTEVNSFNKKQFYLDKNWNADLKKFKLNSYSTYNHFLAGAVIDSSKEYLIKVDLEYLFSKGLKVS